MKYKVYARFYKKGKAKGNQFVQGTVEAGSKQAAIKKAKAEAARLDRSASVGKYKDYKTKVIRVELKTTRKKKPARKRKTKGLLEW